MIELCKKCFTVKNIKKNKLICARCEMTYNINERTKKVSKMQRNENVS